MPEVVTAFTRYGMGSGLLAELRMVVLRDRIKKPTWLSTLKYSTTSVYSLTGTPARLGRPLSSHPATPFYSTRASKQKPTDSTVRIIDHPRAAACRASSWAVEGIGGDQLSCQYRYAPTNAPGDREAK
jgi:hypothetical protein